MKSISPTRRDVLRAAAGVATFTIVPRHVVAASGQTPPSEKLNLACIGIGWPGRKDTDALANQANVVALCDVDASREPEWAKKYAGAKRFQDYRKMFDALDKSIDSVIVATPDHTHAVLIMEAMRRGKHVYSEKPLAHSVHEVRELMKAAKENKVITQLGNQGHASDTTRMTCEWIWDGALGKVHTIHAGCNIVNSALDKLGQLSERPPVPAGLDWDLWLGPAKERPYHSNYLHEKWRAWMPFGNGTIGDWTCHVIDSVFWALDLGSPSTILAEAKEYDPKAHADTFPRGETITFEFAATEKRGPIKLVWHSGTVPIPRPEQLEPERKHPQTGAIVYGDKGALMYGSHGAGGLRLIPEVNMKAYKQPTPTLPRLRMGQEQDWAAAIRENRPAGSDFSYGGRLTEIALLGVIAIKMLGTKLQWDPVAMRFPNCPEANQHVNPPYRAGWKL